MTILFEESFDPYLTGAPGTDDGVFNANGVWAQLGGLLARPSIGPRTGLTCWRVTSNAEGRRVLGGTHTELFTSFGLFFDALPTSDNIYSPITLRTASNVDICKLYLQADGAFELKNSAGVSLGRGSAAFAAGTWNHVQVRLVRNAATGVCQVRLNSVNVLDLAGLALGATDFAIYAATTTGPGTSMYIDDLVINNTAGSVNNSWLGTTRVYAQLAVADTVGETGWTRRPRSKFGGGLIGNPRLKTQDDVNSGIYGSEASQFQFGSGDYTIEGFFNFSGFPSGETSATLLAKWAVSGNFREWRLFHDGNNLKFQYTTDGTSLGIVTVHDFPWKPNLGQYYHIAVSRASGVSYLFIDGVQYGTPKADAGAYFAGGAKLGIFTLTTTTSITAGDQMMGLADEIRITKGFARYSAPFVAPSAAFPRGSGSDPQWANVSLLVGADAALTDESSFATPLVALTLSNSFFQSGRLTADDADAGYQIVGHEVVRDYTFLQAPLLQATSLFISTANRSNGETITLGSVTYTFKTVLASANDILIGANNDATLFNFVSAVNADAGEGTLYGTGTVMNPNAYAEVANTGTVRVFARTAGASGNALATTETCANAFWTGATMSGGVSIPGVSSFKCQSLPPLVTGLMSLTLVSRARKSDSGDANMQMAFVTADNSSFNGTDRAMTTSFTYYQDRTELDPSTAGPLTPSAFATSRIRLDRTS